MSHAIVDLPAEISHMNSDIGGSSSLAASCHHPGQIPHLQNLQFQTRTSFEASPPACTRPNGKIQHARSACGGGGGVQQNGLRDTGTAVAASTTL